MAYHLSVVEIIHEINQQDTPPYPKPRTPEMSITRAKITKTNIQEKINLEQTPSFRMKVERTNDGFVTSYAPKDSDNRVSKDVKGADLVTKLDKDHYYVGSFASRNAKITVSDAQIAGDVLDQERER